MKKINSSGFGGKVIGKISFGCGAAVLIGFAILLAVELNQDKRLNNYCQNKINERRALPNNLFECAACGNRQVAAHDISCPVCGIRFKMEEIQNGKCKN